MNQKFTIDQYDICASFKADNVVVMSAQFLPTGEYFLSQTVELTRIKKDTIVATLERKSEKNLRCQFEQLVDEEHKELVIKFIVSFDFLPQFSQKICLPYVEKKQSIKTMQVNNFRADVEKIQGILDAFNKNGVWNFSQIGSQSFASSQKLVELKRFQIIKGRYLLRISGIYTNSIGQAGVSDKLTFQISSPGAETHKKVISAYSVSGYSYPFSFEQVIESNDGQLKIQVKSSGTVGSYSNVYIILCPIGDFR